MSAVGPLALPRTSKMCVVVAARRHPLHKCAMMQPRGCGSRDVPRNCPVQTRVRADVRRSFGWGRVVVRVVCAMCARAVSERGAKRRSPPLRHPHTVFLPVSTLQAVAESSVGCLHGWRCAVACPLLACACSFGRWQRSRVQAKSEYTHYYEPARKGASASVRPEYVIIPRWFTVHHMRGGTLSEAGGVGPMNAVRRSTAARPLERARVRSSWAIAAPWLRTR